MKRYRITLDSHTFDVRVLDDPRRAQVRVEVDGETFVVGVEVVPPTTQGTAEATAPSTASSHAAPPRLPKISETSEVSDHLDGTVAAPLPGVVKMVTVHPGQRVAADDELLVIEAMKMDNVIRAPRPGTVGTVHVAAGRQVAYGEPLLEMTRE